MKSNALLKTLIILVIVVVSLISFVGLYQKKNNIMVNVIPDPELSMSLDGARVIQMVVDDSTKEVIYDAEGNVTEEGLDDEGNLKEGYTKVDEKVNKDEILTEENYKLAKKIIDERLEKLGLSEYTIRLNNEYGTITVEVPENTYTDRVVSNLIYTGKFEIVDSDTKEVLINNSDIKKANAVYSNTETGTRVYLSIQFNNEGKKKFENVTSTYISSVDEEGNTITKNVSINLDDDSIMTTHFDQTISNGLLQLSIGNESTDSEQISNYIQEASEVAALITTGSNPIVYEIESNTFLKSGISSNEIMAIVVCIAVVALIGFIYFVAKYKLSGLFGYISFIGFTAILWLALKGIGITISIEGIVAIVVMLIANYMWINYILKRISKDENVKQVIKESYIHYTYILIPLAIIAVVFTFTRWTVISSIGMVMVWALMIMFIYQYAITKVLLDK